VSASVQAPDIEQRPPVAYLNYRNDVVGAIGAMIEAGDACFGPSTMGEALWPVEAVFDPETGRTRVGISYVAPAGTEWAS
jgi:hypothetical protein